MNEVFKNEICGRYFAFDIDRTGERYEYVVALILDIDVIDGVPFAVVMTTAGVRRIAAFHCWKNVNLYSTSDEALAEVERLNREENSDEAGDGLDQAAA